MKNEKTARLNVWAFALASGVIGLLVGIWMSWSWGSSYMGNMMLRFGMPFMSGFGSVGMAICFAITGGALAWIYNLFAEHLEK